MKDVCFAVYGSLLCICISCNDSSTASVERKDYSQAQKNLDTWHVVSMAFATGNKDAVDSVIADDYIDHTSIGDVNGRDSVKARISRMHTNYTDIKMERIKELADNDFAFIWMHFTGKSKGTPAIPAGPFDINTIQVAKFQNGKIVEHWEFRSVNEVFKMMQKKR